MIFLIRHSGGPHFCGVLASVIHGDIIAFLCPYIDLTGTVQLPIGIVATFLPLADPPGQTPNGEHDGEHVKRDADGP